MAKFMSKMHDCCSIPLPPELTRVNVVAMKLRCREVSVYVMNDLVPCRFCITILARSRRRGRWTAAKCTYPPDPKCTPPNFGSLALEVYPLWKGSLSLQYPKHTPPNSRLD
eukprot:scaffold19611_cov67-Cyclotella_meneghiniana.AAC.5